MRTVVTLLLTFALWACADVQEQPMAPSDAPAELSHAQEDGFDKYGYNYQAQLFNGLADGVDRNLDGAYWGNTTFANDRLKMSWSEAWDEAAFHGAEWTCDAWTDNQWNGRVPDGSGQTWHYRIVWVGPELEDSPCWREGGYPVWGQFEVIMSHGTVANQHFWDAHAIPAGFGAHNGSGG